MKPIINQTFWSFMSRQCFNIALSTSEHGAASPPDGKQVVRLFM